MSLPKLYTLSAFQLTATGPSVTVIDQISRYTINEGIGTLFKGSSGKVYNKFQGIRSKEPRLSFSTSSLKAMLDITEVSHSPINAALYAQAFFEKFAEGGTRESGNNHIDLRINEGILVPRRLSSQHRADAEIEYELIASYNGANEPFVWADFQPLPTAQDIALWTIGNLDIDGAYVGQILSVDVDFGVRAMAKSSDSDLYVSFTGVEKIQPSIRLRMNDMSLVTTYGDGGEGAVVKLYFRKRIDQGTFEDDAEEVHIKLTANKCQIYIDSHSLSEGMPGEFDLIIEPIYDTDGANNPFVLDTTSAIPDLTP